MSEEKNLYRRGTALKRTEKGLLYLDFAPTRIIALRPVPVRAWYTARTPDAKWRGTIDTPLDIASLIRDQRTQPNDLADVTQVQLWRRRNFASFLHEVPKEVQDLVADGWTGNTWPLFRLLQSTPESRDIAESKDGGAVMYALALAHNLLPRGPVTFDPPKATLAFARRWLKHPRRAILGRLGFPATNASVKALAKVPRHHLETYPLELLRNALNHPESMKRGAHLPRLPHVILSLLQPDIVQHVGTKLLTSLVDDERTSFFEADSLARLIRDARAIADTRGEVMPVFTSEIDIGAHHDALVSKQRAMMQIKSKTLPKFPSILTDDEKRWVRPLRSTLELIEEGERMHHCLGTLDSHHALAEKGKLYALALEGKERLTLAIEQRPTGTWTVHDFRGVANSPPSKDALTWARDLLRRMDGNPLRQTAPDRRCTMDE